MKETANAFATVYISSIDANVTIMQSREEDESNKPGILFHISRISILLSNLWRNATTESGDSIPDGLHTKRT